jgi:hypothetical protein
MVLAANAETGKWLAQTRCVPCHAVVADQRREVADAPPFDAIANNAGWDRMSWPSICSIRIRE